MTYSHIAAARIRVNKRQYLSLVIGIFLSIFLISTLVQSVWGIYQAHLERRYKTIGYLDIVVLDNENIDIVTEEAVLETGDYSRLGHAYISGVVTDRNVYLGYYDEIGLELLNLSVVDGRMPSSPGEIAMERSAMDVLNVDCIIGDTVELDITPIDGVEETRKFTLVGILPERSIRLARIDYNGIGQFPGIVTSADEQPFDTGRVAYHYMLDFGKAGSISDTLNTFWTKFKNHQVGAAIFGISITGEQVWWTGTGDFINSNNEMLSPMLIASVLAVSLILSCCIGISGAMEGILSKRREEIGVLRALGATRRQIRRMFGQENLILALILSPMSILISMVAVWLLSQLMPESLKFTVNLWLIIPIALISITVILITGYLPLARASKQMPISVIQDRATIRRNKGIKSKNEFSTTKLIAYRQLRLNPTRQIGAILLVALMLFCSGMVGVLFYVYDWEFSIKEDAGFVVSNSYGGASWNWITRYDHDSINSEAIEELRSLDHVEDIYIHREIKILAQVDTVPRYAMTYYIDNNFGMLDDTLFQEAMEFRSDREAYEPDREQDRAEYLQLKENYGFAQDVFQTSIMTIDLSDENIAILQGCLAEGNIDVEAINAGEQVLLLAPEVWMKVYENGSSIFCTQDYPFFEEYKAEGAVKVAWNNCFSVGQKLPLTQLYSEDNSYATVIRNEADVQICGILNSLGNLPYNNWNCCVVITTEQGLENMGMRMEGLRRIELNLDDELSQDEEERLERQINAIARRFEGFSVQNRIEQNRERVQAHRQELLVMVSVVVLFFAVAVAMIVSSVTRQLHSEGRTIGLLRAVGADEKTILGCYSGQMTTAVLGGLGLTLIGGCIFICGCWIDAILSDLRFWYWDVTVLVIIVGVTAVVMATFCWLVCHSILRHRIREVVNMSIIENIREL